MMIDDNKYLCDEEEREEDGLKINDDIIYIGDSYELDYLPALKIGINPILLDRKGLKKDDQTCHSVRNYKQLNKILMSKFKDAKK